MKYLYRIFPWFHTCFFIVEKAVQTKVRTINNKQVTAFVFESYCEKCRKYGVVTIFMTMPEPLVPNQPKINNVIDKLGLFKN